LNEPDGVTFNLQQFSTEDGPGIRTTVFLKGCQLNCAWCHNPEGMRPETELVWHDVRCIAASLCLEACPEKALQLSPRGMQIDRQRCTACGDCAAACPSAALELIGQRWTSDALLAELLKDRVFYETSGGGVTFSGGEPMLQAPFLSSLLPHCKEAGLHVALDTCGAAAWSAYREVLQWVDLVLFDLKLIDEQRHRRSTGASNRLILDNARQIAALGLPIWIRTPVIPDFTDDRENIQAIGRFIRQDHRLDRSYLLDDAPLLTRHKMESLWQVAAEHSLLARWSGATCN
jgi:pyruvate formate lyase activating enzyme